MSDYDDWDDDSDDGQGSKALQEARAAAKANAKKVKELSEQLTKMQSAVRDRSVKDVLTAKGLSDKIARFIPPDATTSEEVEAWLAENGDVFGIDTQANEAATPPPANPEVDAFNRISQVQSSGQTLTQDPDQLRALINSATGPEELNKLLFGNAMGPQAI